MLNKIAGRKRVESRASDNACEKDYNLSRAKGNKKEAKIESITSLKALTSFFVARRGRLEAVLKEFSSLRFSAGFIRSPHSKFSLVGQLRERKYRAGLPLEI